MAVLLKEALKRINNLYPERQTIPRQPFVFPQELQPLLSRAESEQIPRPTRLLSLSELFSALAQALTAADEFETGDKPRLKALGANQRTQFIEFIRRFFRKYQLIENSQGQAVANFSQGYLPPEVTQILLTLTSAEFSPYARKYEAYFPLLQKVVSDLLLAKLPEIQPPIAIPIADFMELLTPLIGQKRNQLIWISRAFRNVTQVPRGQKKPLKTTQSTEISPELISAILASHSQEEVIAYYVNEFDQVLYNFKLGPESFALVKKMLTAITQAL